MKYLIFSALFIPFLLSAQEVTIDGDPIQQDSVVEVENTTQNQLYIKGLEWFADIYVNSQKVIQLKDKEAGIIMGKASFETVVKGGALLPKRNTSISYTVRLQFKDGRFRYTIKDFIQESVQGSPGYGMITDGEIIEAKKTVMKIANKQYKELQKAIYKQIFKIETSILATFENDLSLGEGELDDDW